MPFFKYVIIFYKFMFEWILGSLISLIAYNKVYIHLIRRKVKGPVSIMKGAEPYLKKRPGKKVALLLHGYTTSPREFRRLANYLSKRNISVYAPLLPGHGTSPERLAFIKYVQWIEFVEEQIKMLEKDYKEIYLIGNSYGGNLSLITANKSKKIKGVVTLGTPIFFKQEKISRYFLLPILKRIKVFQKKPYNQKEREYIEKKSKVYLWVPMRSLPHALKIIDISKKSLPEIKKPLLTIFGGHKPGAEIPGSAKYLVDEQSSKYIYDNISSKKKKRVEFVSGTHVFIIDKKAYKVYKEIWDFIKEN
jgi:carboxylesterase